MQGRCISLSLSLSLSLFSLPDPARLQENSLFCNIIARAAYSYDLPKHRPQGWGGLLHVSIRDLSPPEYTAPHDCFHP